jgi:hypothetical protein
MTAVRSLMRNIEKSVNSFLFISIQTSTRLSKYSYIYIYIYIYKGMR